VEKFCEAFDPIRVVIVGKSSRKIAVPENCVNLLNQTTLLQLIWLIRAARSSSASTAARCTLPPP